MYAASRDAYLRLIVVPDFMKFGLLKAIVQRVFQHLRLIAVFDPSLHAAKSAKK